MVAANGLFEMFYFVFNFISMQHAFDPHFPFSSSDFYWKAVRKRFVQEFYFVFIVILMQCPLDPHQFPSSSSSVAIRRQNTPPGAGRGGGRHCAGRLPGPHPFTILGGRRARVSLGCSRVCHGEGGGGLRGKAEACESVRAPACALLASVWRIRAGELWPRCLPRPRRAGTGRGGDHR